MTPQANEDFVFSCERVMHNIALHLTALKAGALRVPSALRAPAAGELGRWAYDGEKNVKARRIDGFFYGLFLDSDVLRNAGVIPDNPRQAFVDDFELRIGERATLVPRIGARSYGMLFAMTHEELDRLYSAPSLTDYRPEAVVAETFEGERVPALCYDLMEAPRNTERNADYAARLRSALGKLAFPASYIDSV